MKLARKSYTAYQNNKTYWEMDIIEKRIRNMIYLVKRLKFVYNRHLNQIKKQHSNVEKNNCSEEEPMDIIFDTFNMLAPQTAPEVRRQ